MLTITTNSIVNTNVQLYFDILRRQGVKVVYINAHTVNLHANASFKAKKRVDLLAYNPINPLSINLI